MSIYATRQRFGTKRAAVGDVVVIAVQKHAIQAMNSGIPCLQAGIIVSISKREDRPHIRVLKTGETNYDNADLDWKFVTCLTEADVGRLQIGEWTWPLKESRWRESSGYRS